MVLVRHPSMASLRPLSSPRIPFLNDSNVSRRRLSYDPRLLNVRLLTRLVLAAEFRGPGIHHMEDSGDDYDMDMDHRARPAGGRSGRIILLGDGTEVLTDSADTEMFDNDEEEKDLGSQVNKNGTDPDDSRNTREGTPGPTSASDGAQSQSNSETSPAVTHTEGSEKQSEPSMKAASDTALSKEQQDQLVKS